MIDITHSNLVAFLKQELQVAVSKNPRFRKNFGDVQHAFGNTIHFSQGDVRVVVTNVSGQGTRLSPDYFLCTMMGRACAAKIEGKEGAFIEWTKELDPDGTSVVPGFYYFNVASVNEATGEVLFDFRFMRWEEHRSTTPAHGSLIWIDPNLWRPEHITATGLALGTDYRHISNGIILHTYQDSLQLHDADSGQNLVAGKDWFVLRHDRVKLADTQGGCQYIQMPPTVKKVMHFEDQDGYLLREGNDYWWTSERTIKLSDYTPVAHEIYVVGDVLLDPTTTPLVHAENQLKATPNGNESVVKKETIYKVGVGTFGYDDIHVRTDGTMWFKHLADQGDRVFWEVRYQEPLTTKTAEKHTVTMNLVPGVQVALGDEVVVGDQAVVIVFPSVEETYEVYGSKEAITFDIEVHSNDLMTSSELASSVRNLLAVQGRSRHEAAGLTIFEISRSYRGEQKDISGTVAKHVVTLGVTAAADWELHIPLVTRVDEIGLEQIEIVNSYPGKPLVEPRINAFGRTRFSQGHVPYYC